MSKHSGDVLAAAAKPFDALVTVAAFDQFARDASTDASNRARAGTSERSGRPGTGEAWPTATRGGGPFDIG